MLKWVAAGIFILIFILVVLVFLNSVYHEPLAVEPAPKIDFNSSSISFVSDRDGNEEIYLTDLGGEQEIRLTNNGSADFLPVLSPTKDQMVYFTQEDEGFLLKRCQTSPYQCSAVTFTRNRPRSILFSPDGKKILVKEAVDNKDSLFLVTLEPAGAQLVSREVEFGTWSYDSQTVIYQKSTTAGELWIRTMDVDGRLAEPYLTASEAAAPVSEANTRGLIYVDFSATSALVRATLRGERQEKIMDLPDLQKIDKIRLTSREDSSILLLTSFGLNSSVSLISLTDKTVTPLDCQGENITFFDTNSYVYQQTDPQAKSQIWVSDQGEIRQLTDQGNNWFIR